MKPVAPTIASAAALPASLLAVITWLIALQPVATDLYLAALPTIDRQFGGLTSASQLTLAAYIGAFGFAQLLAGPLSDRYGRYPVALWGTAIYTIAALVGALADDVTQLILARLAQGTGTACTVVASRAVIRDLFTPEEGARVLGRSMAWSALAPLLAPTMGGLLTSSFSWRATFAAMAVAGAIGALGILTRLTESNRHPNRAATRARPLLRNYRTIGVNPAFLIYTLAVTFSFSALFSYIAGSSFVLINVVGLSPAVYGMAFSTVALGFVVGTMIMRRWVARIGLTRVIQWGAAIGLTAGAVLLALALARIQTAVAVVGPMVFVLLAHGMVQPAGMMGAAAPFPANAGAAAALLGFAMNLAAAWVAWLIGRNFDGTTLPLAAQVFGATVLTALTAFVAMRRLRGP